MRSKSMAAQQREWQRQDDARVLAQAKQIQADPNRLKGAQAEAKKMAAEQEQNAKAMRQVAGKQTTKK